MTKNRRAISDAMASAGGSRNAGASARPQEHDPHFRPGRVGKTNVTGYFPKEVKTQLRMLAAEHETTIQALLAEALNDLFARYGKPEIAPVDDHNDR